MDKKIIEDIKELGFTLYDAGDIDIDGSYYESYSFFQKGTTLEINFEYNAQNEIVHSYVEFENNILKGIKVTPHDLKVLIKFIYNIDYENRT